MINITKNHPLFTALYWVTLAKAKDARSPISLKYIKVEIDRFLATDGYILHMYTPHFDYSPVKIGWIPGLYEVKKVTKSEILLVKTQEDITYPNYKSAIPSLENHKTLEFKTKTISGLFCNFIKNLHPQAGLDYNYFKDLITAPGQKTFSINSEKLPAPLVLKSEHCLGLLMPLDLTLGEQ